MPWDGEEAYMLLWVTCPCKHMHAYFLQSHWAEWHLLPGKRACHGSYIHSHPLLSGCQFTSSQSADCRESDPLKGWSEVVGLNAQRHTCHSSDCLICTGLIISDELIDIFGLNLIISTHVSACWMHERPGQNTFWMYKQRTYKRPQTLPHPPLPPIKRLVCIGHFEHYEIMGQNVLCISPENTSRPPQ